MKEQILKLREQGKTYLEISKELKCSKATVNYHCGQGQKEKSANRGKLNRQRKKLGIVVEKSYLKNKKTELRFLKILNI